MFKQFLKNCAHTKELIFVAAAMSKDETRYALNFIYSTGERIVATDGHRCHLYAPEDCPLEEGFYKVMKRTKTVIDLLKTEVDGQYPDFDRIIPKDEGLVGFSTYTMEATNNAPLKLAEVLRGMATSAISIDFFLDAINHESISMFRSGDGFEPIKFKGGFLTAVIMPLRTEVLKTQY